MLHGRLLVLIVFISGFVSLAYQTVWLREMRLFFGASTPATAAVTGIFMLGLGVGGLLLGRRVDRSSTPLRFYGWVEIAISILTAITLLTIPVSRALYLGLGGSQELGTAGAMIVRIALAALIIGPATFAMGATLPAAARSYTRAGDESRSGLGVLYGANTLGAVVGTVASTFVLLETLGQRGTLSIAVLLNALIGAAALGISRGEEEVTPATPTRRVAGRTSVYVLAAMAGFTFFVLELVWYRMLAPILGGSTYTFGLILAIALAGIGSGGALYGLLQRDDEAPKLSLLSFTFGLQALAVIAAWAMGDHVAVTAALLNHLGSWGFYGSVLAWTIVAFVVVFPASAVAGYQFPVLVGLVGRGRDQIGGDTGEVYLWNTAGSLVGALAGGLLLIPMFGATGLWRACAVLLCVLSLATLVIHVMQARAYREWGTALVVGATLVLAFVTSGPTAAWRHSPIGAGRVDTEDFTPQAIQGFLHQQRRAIKWETDGVESSVGLSGADGYAFVVNGKSDGHVRGDAGTQVMSGLLGAWLHGSPKNALVIGLGTGSTAGWLAAVPSVERVDVVEIEPAILHVAEVASAVNRNVLRNPKANVIIADGREVLLTTDQSYDLIFSEPSNPYRAGIASLFTADFYRAVRPRLREGGVFIQWVQAYEIDSITLERIYATVGSVFPSVETWQTQRGDLMLIATERPIAKNAELLRERLRQPPFREAAARIWQTNELEGILAHFMATDHLTRNFGRYSQPVEDDRNTIEFGFARNIRGGRQLHQDLRRESASAGTDRPIVEGAVNWDRVDDLRLALPSLMFEPEGMSELQRMRMDVTQSWIDVRCADAIASWSRLARPAQGPLDLIMLGTCYARLGDADAERYAAALAPRHPTEAAMMRAMLAASRDDHDAPQLLASALKLHRVDPWPPTAVVEATIQVALESAASWRSRPDAIDTLATGFLEPFAVLSAEHRRLDALLFLAELREPECGPRTVAAIEAYGPHVPWTRQFLDRRARCFRRTRHADTAIAVRDLERFLANEPSTLTPMSVDRGTTPIPDAPAPGYTISTGTSATATPTTETGQTP